MKPTDIDRISVERVRKLLTYDAATGHFYWRPRGIEEFTSLRAQRSWNGKYAGKKTGFVGRRHGYVTIGIDKLQYYAHRLAWVLEKGEWPPMSLDHVDCDKTNNAIANLRLATCIQNGANKGLYKNNKSGVKGVYFERGKWRAYINSQRKNKFLGHYETREQAADAYYAAAVQLFGEFAREGRA